MTNFFEDIEEDDYQEESEFPENTGELYEHFRFVADKGQGLLRIDKFLADRIFNATRSRIQQAAEAGCILVNDKAVRSNYRIKPEDVVTIMMDHPKRDVEIIPEEIPLNIVYEDEDLMVINKPPGLVVHPGHGNYSGTMINAVAWHLKDDPAYDFHDPRLGLVHRIDKDTSGLLVVAKNPEAKSDLGMQFYNKTTHRKYNAIVWGIVKEDEGTIVGNIGRSLKERQQMAVFPKGNYGKPAVTHYRVLERLGYITFVECILETGRTHQIRVHMKHIGHTIFNDSRYGGNLILKGNKLPKYRYFVYNCYNVCPRQALHAKTLGFIHPRTKEEMFFDTELPWDMSELLAKWRKYIADNSI